MNDHRLGRQPHALLVDDDPATGPVHMRRLESEGYLVSNATNATSALNAARQSAPDMIFIHLGLRGSGSCAFIEMLRRHDETRHIPIALLSSHYDRSLENLGLTAVKDGW